MRRPNHPTAKAFLGGLMLLLVMSGCGDDDALPEGLPAVCYPLADVVAMSDEYDDLVAGMMVEVEAAVAENPAEGEEAFLSALREMVTAGDPLIDDLAGLYDDAIAVAPSELAADITTLREGTVAAWPLLEDALLNAESIDGLLARVTYAFDDPEFTEVAYDAAVAVLRLDEYTVPECGFRLSREQQE